MKYNARVIDWMCCPDCGSNVMRAEDLYDDGSPMGAIECPDCGFSALEAVDMVINEGFEDWAKICNSVGHEWSLLGQTQEGKLVMACLFCGKQVIE